MTEDLVAWLRAQLDDDERVALAAQSGPWTMRENGGSTPWTDIDASEGTVTSSYEGEVVAVKDAEHIVRWDPARVLAEVEAKRKLLDWLDSWDQRMLNDNYWPWDSTDAVQLLAQPYAGRDGWREEWAA